MDEKIAMDDNVKKNIIHQLTKGLAYLHFKKIFLGTLSPHEVVIVASDVVKIAKLCAGKLLA